MKLKGIIDGVTHWWSGKYWIANKDDAIEMSRNEAIAVAKSVKISNSFLDSDEQVETEIVESI